MAEFTFKNGKLQKSSEAAKTKIDFQGKRKAQGEKNAAAAKALADSQTAANKVASDAAAVAEQARAAAVAEQGKQIGSKTLSVGKGSDQKRD